MANKLIPKSSSYQQLTTRNPTTALDHHSSNLFMKSDDSMMMKQILATHAPDNYDIEVRPLLHLVEDILNRSTMNFNGLLPGTQLAHPEDLEDKFGHQPGYIALPDSLSYKIEQIFCEILCKCTGPVDAHTTTVSVFNMLSNFSWDSKSVLTLAAFALNYGEFWLLAQIYSSNPLAKSMAILKQLPTIMEHSGQLKPRFDALKVLIKAMLDVTKTVIEFKDLPSMYICQEVPAFAAAMSHVPTAVYWTIRSAVACANQINSLTSLGHDHISAEASWELSTFAHKLNNIHEHLRNQLATCYQFIDQKMEVESYQMLLNLFDTIHIDNIKILKAIIYPKDDLLPLVDGSTKRRVEIPVLRRKNVLLLISGLDISNEELSILEQIYNESRTHATRHDAQYEVVWIPIVDPAVTWNEGMQKQFDALQATMPWYTVHHPSLIDRSVIRFIKEQWHFRHKPILVVLDPQGRVACPNAIHMMWIWGSNAFPFTSLREEALWKEEIWRLELLVNGIDPLILTWIKEGKHIFLYGGDDVEWVRKFTTAARATALASRIPLEMVYVGKSTKREQVRKVIATIQVEKLSHYWEDPTMIWFFWARLESMLFSKIQQGRADDQDPITQEIKKLISYEKHGGWAVLCNGSEVAVNGHGSTILPTVLEYDLWKEHVSTQGYHGAFRDHHGKIHNESPACCRFEFQSNMGWIPDDMKCPECRRRMEKFTTFMCCHDESPLDTGKLY